MIPLPIDEILPSIVLTLSQRNATILTAPPGSGKTTRVGPHLVEHLDALKEKKAYLLQPRRVAARAAAERIASERQWDLGGRVGYQVRLDSQLSQKTKLIVATEGVLLRRLQNDPILEEIGLVILDEFHERSLSSDLLLGMLRRIQMTLRPDLRILVMSATLASQSILSYFDQPSLLEAKGQLYPVETKYRPIPNHRSLIDHVVDTILRTIEHREGDVLVFMPGSGEIHQVLDRLKREKILEHWDCLPMHGALSLEDQSRALTSSGRRRIIVATNVAETSLTIEGISIVIDSGLARVLRYDPKVGLDRLELEPISLASATQRAGRAGRLRDGLCIRLWDQASHQARPEYLEPEIRRVDLSGPILQLHGWGEGDGRDFPWLQPPREESMASAVLLLERLGAIANGRITPLGRSMAMLPTSPRLSKLLIEGHRNGILRTAAWTAVLLSEREPFLRNSTSNSHVQGRIPTQHSIRWDSDTLERLHAIERYLQDGTEQTPFGTIHRHAVRSLSELVRRLEEDVLRELGPGESRSQDRDATLMKTLLAAYPDRLAKRRTTGKPKGLMVGGKGVELARSSGVQDAELFLCIDVDAQGTDASVRQASAIRQDWLPQEKLHCSDQLFYHPTQKQVVARRRTLWEDLILSDTPVAIQDEAACSEILFQSIADQIDDFFPFEEKSVRAFLDRTQFLRRWMPELQIPSFSKEWLREILHSICQGKKSLQEVRDSSWLDWLRGACSGEQIRAIDHYAPERIQVPSGNWIRIEYRSEEPPILAVRIQEIFSWRETPRIANGRVPLLLHLLAPNMRPQQITDDLGSFWRTTYEVVRKELRRRYPKHHWPENPLTAQPCSGVTKRKPE